MNTFIKELQSRIHLRAIVAMDTNRTIGKAGKLPWHLPKDLQFFKKKTMGHAILMGRVTFESIGRALPGRKNIVLSGADTLFPEGVTRIKEIQQLKEIVAAGDTVYVIGGAKVYEQLIPYCEGVYLTLVKKDYGGDRYLQTFENEFEGCEILEEDEECQYRYYHQPKKMKRL
jgi:dihydrofolate reductase